MAVGPRAERIGNLPAGGEQNSAQPSADITRQVQSVKRQAESVANRRMGEAQDLIASPQGSGVNGHQIGGGGAMYEWDAGLAINDVEGGGSS